jgi:hypothetical protein
MRGLSAIVAALLVSSSAVADDAADKVKAVCISNAVHSFSEAVQDLVVRQGLKLPTIDDIMERRHLAEAFCLQRAKCDVAADKTQDALGLTFEVCLRDEEMARWMATKQAR